jgi:hypothetical protein
MTELVTREASSWTNVSSDEPDWMFSNWNSQPRTTTVDVQSCSNIMLGEIAHGLLTSRPNGVYRVIFNAPSSFDGIYRHLYCDVLPGLEKNEAAFPILLAWHHHTGGPIELGPLPLELPGMQPSAERFLVLDAMPEPTDHGRSEVDGDENTTVLQMVDDLRAWLDLTYDELASVSGVSRGAFFYWRAQNGSPRPSTTRRIARVHALADLLTRRFGSAGARSWLGAGDPSALELLLDQNLTEVERRARDSLFSQPDLRPSSLHGVGDQPEINVVGTGVPVTRSRRRPKRGASHPK